MLYDSQCVGYFRPDIMEIWLRSPLSALSLGAHQNASLTERDAYLTHLHEWMHYLQAVGTSLGLHRWRLSLIQRYTIRALLGDIVAYDHRIGGNLQVQIPFLKWASACQDIAIRKLLAEYVLGRWDRSEVLCRALWGNYDRTEEPVLARRLAQHGSNYVQPPSHGLAPVISSAGLSPDQPLAGVVVAETAASAFAMLTEGRIGPLKAELGDINLRIRTRHLRKPPLYTSLLKMVDEMGLRPPSLVALALCDIALNPSIPIPGDAPLKWEDFHPGYRFMRALETCEGLQLSDIEPSEQCLSSFVRLVCERGKLLPEPGAAFCRYWDFHSSQVSTLKADVPPEHDLFARAAGIRRRRSACFTYPWLGGDMMISQLPMPFFQTKQDGPNFNIPVSTGGASEQVLWLGRFLNSAIIEYVTRQLTIGSKLLRKRGVLQCPIGSWWGESEPPLTFGCHRGCFGLRIGECAPSDCLFTRVLSSGCAGLGLEDFSPCAG